MGGTRIKRKNCGCCCEKKRRSPVSEDWHVAVTGNPNCGKTSFFNAATRGNQYVGNWPGVTVETVQSRRTIGGIPMKIVDLPGTYSLTPDSEDQMIAGRYLIKGDIELILNVVDATNLERNLYLTLQLIELGLPVAVLLSKSDLLKKEGLSIDADILSEKLGVPVIPVSAISRTSVNHALGKLAKKLPEITPSEIDFPARRSPEELISRRGGESTIRVLPSDDVDRRYRWIEQQLETARKKKLVESNLTDKIDRIVLNRFLAAPLFALSMMMVFWIAVNLGGVFIDFFDILGGAVFVDGTRSFFEMIGLPQWMILILSDGLGSGLQTVATFIPVISFMFLTMAVLEDSGYMARAAFTADSFMRKIGLPGTSFVPLLVGFGCTVPAIMATRTLTSRRDRYMTIFMTPFMSCGARLPVYAVIATALFNRFAGIIVFSLYLAGIAAALVTGFLLKKTLFRDSSSFFMMELPAYHLPRLRNVLKQTSFRLKAFIKKATLVMMIATAFLGVLNSVGTRDGHLTLDQVSAEETLLAGAAKSINPLFAPMGIDSENWPASVALFTGLFAKEAIVSTVSAIYGQQDANRSVESHDELSSASIAAVDGNVVVSEDPTAESESEGESSSRSVNPLFSALIEAFQSIPEAFVALFVTEGDDDSAAGLALRARFTPASAYAYLLFVLLYFPCIAALAAAIKEMGALFATGMAIYSTVLAWSVAVLFYQIAEGHSLIWIAVALLAFALIWGSFRLAAFLFPEGQKRPKTQ